MTEVRFQTLSQTLVSEKIQNLRVPSLTCIHVYAVCPHSQRRKFIQTHVALFIILYVKFSKCTEIQITETSFSVLFLLQSNPSWSNFYQLARK